METTNSKKVFAVLGMLFGVALLIVGIVMATQSYSIGTYVSASVGFNGDFYTYEYQATAIAAQNVNALSRNLRAFASICGWVVAIVGGIVFCYFGCKLGDANSAAAPSYNSAAGLSYGSKASAPKPVQSSGGTWVCNCGTRNPNANKFCNGCGKENNAKAANNAPPLPSDSWRCSRCTAKNPHSAHKCQNCGKEREV